HQPHAAVDVRANNSLDPLGDLRIRARLTLGRAERVVVTMNDLRRELHSRTIIRFDTQERQPRFKVLVEQERTRARIGAWSFRWIVSPSTTNATTTAKPSKGKASPARWGGATDALLYATRWQVAVAIAIPITGRASAGRNGCVVVHERIKPQV